MRAEVLDATNTVLDFLLFIVHSAGHLLLIRIWSYRQSGKSKKEENMIFYENI